MKSFPALSLIGFVCSVLPAQYASAQAQQSETCKDRKVPLSRNDPLLVPGNPQPSFSYKDKTYDMEIYGKIKLITSYTSGKHSICREYEVYNKSGDTIRKLRWPSIGINNFYNIPDGESFTYGISTVSEVVSKDVFPTHLYAWEKAMALSSTIMLSRPIEYKLESDNNEQYALGMIVDKGVSIGISDYKNLGPEVGMYFSGKNGNFSVSSRFYLNSDDNVLIFNTQIDVQWRRSYPRIYSIGISSLYNSENQNNKNNDGGMLAFSKSVLTQNDGNINLTTIIAGTESFQNSENPTYSTSLEKSQTVENSGADVFVVTYPIQISVDDWSACFMVPIYSPIPISLSGNEHCK